MEEKISKYSSRRHSLHFFLIFRFLPSGGFSHPSFMPILSDNYGILKKAPLLLLLHASLVKK